MVEVKDTYPFIEFYLSLVAYFILHMIFVIASDFVEAFNIPPLNIGIYVDKLAAIRALLMVLSDFVEWGITQKGCNDGGNANQSLLGNTGDQKWFEEWTLRTSGWNNSFGNGKGSRRWASILSFFGMLVCRIVYLILLYKSDNKSLSVFITLCLEGFWFGLFQMGFFAIGPEYNAFTSFGIHTMGNIIFFLQVILQYYAKKKPKINCLYRVRVHAWIVVVTSIIALILWICFCLWANAGHGGSPNEWPDHSDVWSPFLLFIVGAFAEDFAVPGILPFAFLDPDKANLVNYLTPSFFMTGALVTVIFNDWWDKVNYKAWSCSSPEGNKGMYWHALWLLNIPKYIAFFIAMWSIHGTYDSLRCIIQSRWRVMWLTLTVVVPRAVLETSGYVGVANWSIGRGDPKLAATAALIEKLKEEGNINDPSQVDAEKLKNAIGAAAGTNPLQIVIAKLVNAMYKAEVNEPTSGQKDITADDKDSGTTAGNLKVVLEPATGGSGGIQRGEKEVSMSFKNSGKLKVTIKIDDKKTGTLKKQGDTSGKETTEAADEIAKKIVEAVKLTNKDSKNARGAYNYVSVAGADYNAFDYIAWHDVTAMFCRFVYVKFAVGYNSF